MLLAVDPGLRGCGCAWLGSDGDVHNACYVRNPERNASGPQAWIAMAHAVGAQSLAICARSQMDRLVVEGQRVYGALHLGAKSGADPNDLLELAGVCGAIAFSFAGLLLHRVLPRDWKGQMPKDICHQRVLGRLSADERARIVLPQARGRVSESLAHNVYDAVGIGLWAVGRFGGLPCPGGSNPSASATTTTKTSSPRS